MILMALLRAKSKLRQQQSRRFKEAKAKIIWSRIRQRQHSLHSGSAHHRQSSSLESTSLLSLKGAFPSHPSATLESVDEANNQMANGTKHKEGASSGDDEAQQSASGEPANGAASLAAQPESENEQTRGSAINSNHRWPQLPTGRKTGKSGSHLSTEIAVDWLNNLLFVLDKYRLFVVDFDGNNELVLIDDFNANNRPVDIKVDPINDFLFWLQIGKFHNTIYKLDLSVLSMPSATERLLTGTLKTSESRFKDGGGSSPFSSDLVPLISHHYAHPVITNLPKHVKLFIIDHKHSRIYVPLAPSSSEGAKDSNNTETIREDTEVFDSQQSSTSVITHMNSTSNNFLNESNPLSYTYGEDHNCTTTDKPSDLASQILAYNLDGTDVGPLRSSAERGHLSGLNDIQDITLDSQKNFLYWLTNDGRELFEEYKAELDSSFYSAQHNLTGKKYLKLKYVDNGSNQPTDVKPRFNLRKLIHMLSASTSSNRWIRSERIDDNFVEGISLQARLNGRHRAGPSDSQVSPNTLVIILGISSLVVILILIYTFTQRDRHLNGDNQSRGDSIGGSFLEESQVDGVVSGNGYNGVGTSTIAKWLDAKPQVTRGSHTSTFNRSSAISCDFESTNYDTSNATAEQYRDFMSANQNSALDFDLETNLANLSEWPISMNDVSNKLYVPAEVFEDDQQSEHLYDQLPNRPGVEEPPYEKLVFGKVEKQVGDVLSL